MKNLIIAVLLICFGASSFYACNKDKEATKLQNDRDIIEKLVYAEAIIIPKYIKNENNSITESTSVSKEVNSIINISDTAALAIEILKKQIIDLTRISTSIKAENLAAQIRIDSLNRRVYFYKDKFLSLSYRPPVDTVDTGRFDFAYDADLTVTQYSKRKNFLSSKKYLIDIYSNDPRTTVNGVKKLSIEREVQPKFRLQSSMVYNATFNTLTPGFIGRFEVKRYSLSGSYMYSPVRKQWFTAVGFNYDLIRF